MQKISINLKERKNGPLSLILCACSVRHAEHYIRELNSNTGEEEKIIVNLDAFHTTEEWNEPKRAYKQAIVSTGITVPSEFWDNENKKIITGYPKAKKLNEDLRSFKKNVQRLFDSLELAGKKIEPVMLKKYIVDHIVNNRANVKVFDFTNEENKHLFSS
ncbi:MAG: Arm DNA-binding domain-containing protein, partial [Bacteroidota bacterium]